MDTRNLTSKLADTVGLGDGVRSPEGQLSQFKSLDKQNQLSDKEIDGLPGFVGQNGGSSLSRYNSGSRRRARR
ncbi:hypothetical protein [Aliiglaciecola sp. M165]|uniref:hypothetical protein n=1 Tax=Aliiglaciecola sp. M165 TaxID=2593649 RepID=UPI00117DF8E2|nr:hypothetical protein [Aliiglaciecola sp. M165]TRY29766.1 hypothetical protein FM019_16470 [Aliiglaciecola sp. M165]